MNSTVLNSWWIQWIYGNIINRGSSTISPFSVYMASSFQCLPVLPFSFRSLKFSLYSGRREITRPTLRGGVSICTCVSVVMNSRERLFVWSMVIITWIRAQNRFTLCGEVISKVRCLGIRTQVVKWLEQMGWEAWYQCRETYVHTYAHSLRM